MSPKHTLANEKIHKQEEMAHFSIGSACTLNYSACTATHNEERNTIISLPCNKMTICSKLGALWDQSVQLINKMKGYM